MSCEEYLDEHDQHDSDSALAVDTCQAVCRSKTLRYEQDMVLLKATPNIAWWFLTFHFPYMLAMFLFTYGNVKHILALAPLRKALCTKRTQVDMRQNFNL